jgi:large subunit ribosomal protein L4
MPEVEIRDVRGDVVGRRELPEELFGRAVNVGLMHQVVVAGAAARRAGTHATKTRGDVSGGGVKPWRQKGTGRARQGSVRAPHWMGGGVAHGPHPRDYAMRVNRKMKRAALRSALSDAASTGKLAVVDELAFDAPRTKDAVALLRALELRGRVLLVTAQPDEALEKSFRNLPEVRVGHPGNLSTFDVLIADRVLFTSAALDALTGEAPSGPRGRVDEPEEPASPEDRAEPAPPDEPEEPASPDDVDTAEEGEAP